ncbi:MAG: o-succinylbenzoate synthase [Candidatus Nanopelagicales bacterium]|jgi:o-succinylbenzoate synthase|nr:o-succinylbenzoate synthase [Actinomycetes bacterium]MCH9738121.1 o-succinylbenzoate synthase [Actinomycetes bacterium]MCH9830924.1 o-succinylbenzoate synthase [Actinomycetes bacterium]MCH9841107.1 o-succinylbenzoate synthase [Actinomycetes bacterium]
MSISFVIHSLEIPLVRPFRTSFGSQSVRDVVLVEAVSDNGVSGWGECVTMAWPGYSAEYTRGAVNVMRDFLIPTLAPLVGESAADSTPAPDSVRAALAVMQGNPMAKSAVETALLDLWLKERNLSLGEFLGAVRDRVDCGVSVGIPSSIEDLIQEVGQYVEQGYRRIKLKVEPGWDLDALRAVRNEWPGVPLQVDANQAYRRSDAEHLARFDEFDLLLIEQPLPEDDILGHKLISSVVSTPICLDESILSVDSAEGAIEFGATTIVNIKPGRVGGFLTARDIHDLCVEKEIPVWCGGMLETGVGRAANIALAALPGFTLPGDTSASSRYYKEDVTEPFVLDNGQLAVPTGPGIGIEPIAANLAEMSTATERVDV